MRMKENYEDRTRYFLPRRTYTILRLDGRAFHTYTKNCKRPFDDGLINDIDNATIKLMEEVQGAKFAYLQSDEISILMTDFETPLTCAWFDGNIQKICSVAASVMTAEFNKLRFVRYDDKFKLATFDARCFTIPDRIEVYNYFVWRNQDCARNSLNMVAQEHFSHKELQGKSNSERHEMLMSKGINWSNLENKYKNGRVIYKQSIVTKVELAGMSFVVDGVAMAGKGEITKQWVSQPAWKFTEYKNTLIGMIPEYKRE